MALTPLLAALPLLAPLAPAASVEPVTAQEAGVVALVAGQPLAQREFESWLLLHRGPMLSGEYIRIVAVDEEAKRQGIRVTDEEVERELAAPFQERIVEAFEGSRDAWLDEVRRLGRSEAGLFSERRILTRTHLQVRGLVAKNRRLPKGYLEAEWERRYGIGGSKPLLRGVLFHVPDPRRGGAEQRLELQNAALQRAEQALRDVAAGADLAELAGRLSDHPSRENGGMTASDFSIEDWPAPSRAAVAALSVGELSEPLLSAEGVWIVRVEEILETPLESVRDALSAELLAAPPTEKEYIAYSQDVVDASPFATLPALLEPSDPNAPDWAEEIVMRVGEREISRGEYATFLRRLQGELRVDRFALAREIQRRANDAGFTVSDEEIEARVEADIQALVDFSHRGERQSWVAELMGKSRTEALYLYEARLRTRTKMLAEKLIIRDREIADETVRQTWIDRYGAGGVTTEARMLVLRPTPPADLDPNISRDDYDELIARIDAENKQLAEELRERYEDGEDFEALVRQFSNDPETREMGGKMDGPFDPTEWNEAISDTVRATPLGELTPPLRFGPTWTLFEITKRTEIPFDRIKDELRESLRTELPSEPELAGYRNLLSREIPIEILPAMFE